MLSGSPDLVHLCWGTREVGVLICSETAYGVSMRWLAKGVLQKLEGEERDVAVENNQGLRGSEACL